MLQMLMHRKNMLDPYIEFTAKYKINVQIPDKKFVNRMTYVNVGVFMNKVHHAQGTQGNVLKVVISSQDVKVIEYMHFYFK